MKAVKISFTTMLFISCLLQCSDYKQMPNEQPRSSCCSKKVKGSVIFGGAMLLGIYLLSPATTKTPAIQDFSIPDQPLLPGDPCNEIIIRECQEDICHFKTIVPVCSALNSSSPLMQGACPAPKELIFKDSKLCKQSNLTKCFSDTIIHQTVEMRCSEPWNTTTPSTPKERITDIRRKFKETRTSKK
jgi:hypothetical protein